MRGGPSSYVAAFAAVALAVAGAFWLVRGGGRDTVDPGGRWLAYPDAFPVEHDWQGGPHLLVAADNGCFVGLGRDGLSAGYWYATGDCTRPTSIAPSRRPPIGDSLPSEDRIQLVATIPAHGGGYLALSRYTYHGDAYAYDTQVLLGGPGSGWRRVAQFRTDDPTASHIGPIAVVAVPQGYVAVGRHNTATVAWASPDGATWREVPLPTPAGLASSTVTGIAADRDGRLVAVGTAGSAARATRAVAWASTDGGASWRLAEVPAAGGRPSLATVVHNGAEFVAVGGVDADLRGAALVLRSTDGLLWTRDDLPIGMRTLTAATALPGGRVLAAAGEDGTAGRDAAAERPDETCAIAWHWDSTQWTAEQLGCHGVPTSFAPLRDGRVAAVHWRTLFLRA